MTTSIQLPYMVARKEPFGAPFTPLAAFASEGHARQHCRMMSTQSLATYCVLERGEHEVSCILEASRGLTVDQGRVTVATIYWETYALHLPAKPAPDLWTYGETVLDPDDGLSLQEAYDPITDAVRTSWSYKATSREADRLREIDRDYRKGIEHAANAGAFQDYLREVKL